MMSIQRRPAGSPSSGVGTLLFRARPQPQCLLEVQGGGRGQGALETANCLQSINSIYPPSGDSSVLAEYQRLNYITKAQTLSLDQ